MSIPTNNESWLISQGDRIIRLAYDVYREFKQAGLAAFQALGLPCAAALFELQDGLFEDRYLGVFDDVCNELANAQHSDAD